MSDDEYEVILALTLIGTVLWLAFGLFALLTS